MTPRERRSRGATELVGDRRKLGSFHVSAFQRDGLKERVTVFFVWSRNSVTHGGGGPCSVHVADLGWRDLQKTAPTVRELGSEGRRPKRAVREYYAHGGCSSFGCLLNKRDGAG